MKPNNMTRLPGTLLVLSPRTESTAETLASTFGGLPEVLVLVEPDPGVVQSLRLRFAGLPGVRIIDAAVAGSALDAELIYYNLPGLRSFKSPTDALRNLFPGLAPRSRRQIRTVPLAKLMNDLGELPSPARLILDAGGAEFDILQGLEASGRLTQFSEIRMRCGAEAMFEGTKNRAVLQDWLEKRGFRLKNSDSTDPEWPWLHLQADPAHRRIAELEQEKGAISKALEDTKKLAGEQRARIAELEHRLNSSRDELRRAEGQIRIVKDLLFHEAAR